VPHDEPNDTPIWFRLLGGYFYSMAGVFVAISGLTWMVPQVGLAWGILASIAGVVGTVQGIVELVRCYRSVRW
jgi:hypothetical protein